MKLSRVMIAAPSSGSGKTTVTCALLELFKNRKRNAVSYKCGPDYIDPMFHRQVFGVKSGNLDTYFTGERTLDILLDNSCEDDFVIMEGVMGLYDGLGGVRDEGSSYHLAKITDTPVILVIDAKGMGRSLAALIKGFLHYDKAQLIKGVIFNRMSKGFYDTIKPLIETETGIKVLGYIKENPDFRVESRHLGLFMPQELENTRDYIKNISEQIEKTVNIEQIEQIADSAKEIEKADDVKADAEKAADVKVDSMKAEAADGADVKADSVKSELADDVDAMSDSINAVLADANVVIAVAYDDAFCFYYEDNIRLLKKYGAKIEYFSPLADTKLPEGCCAVLLGGGYPELHAEKLSANKEMLCEIKKAAEGGMPVVAECGGFMYLHSKLTDMNNVQYDMADVIKGTCFYTGKLVRFGYIEIKENKPDFMRKESCIKGHEFHYFDSDCNGDGCVALKPVSKKSYPCIVTGENIFAGFPHLYYPSNPSFAENFVLKAARYCLLTHIH